MIYEKELTAPVYKRRSVRREFSLSGEKTGALTAAALHFKPSARGIVCAEGARRIGKSKHLLCTEGHAEELFEYADGALLSPAGERFPFEREPLSIFCFVLPGGGKEYFALTEDGCFRLRAEKSGQEESEQEGGAEKVGEGGVCGAVHGERLFVAGGSDLRWSAPLDPANSAEGVQTAGHTVLPSADGDILAAVSLGDELYLFRERGIAALSVRGDALAFAAWHIPAPCGVRAGSVRKCGGAVLFLAGDGLYSFDGKSCKLLFDGGTYGLDLSDTDTAVCGDRYYAAASYNGERCIWCIGNGEAHLIRARAEKLTGGEKLLFTAEGELYELTGRGLPPLRRKECVMRTEKSHFGLSARQKFLDAILIEGKGHFRVEAKGECGLPRAVFGRAGERLRFPLPVRGCGFSFDIRTLDEDACIRAAVFDLREEVARW